MFPIPQPTEMRPGRGRERALIAVCAIVTIAAITGVVLLLTGGDEPARTAPLASGAPTDGTPSSSPAAATPGDRAAEEAKARYFEFIRTKDRVAQGGYDAPEMYKTVAIDPHETQLQLGARRFGDQRSTGDTQVASVTIQSVDLDSQGSYRTVRLLSCLDVSQVTVVNGAGESVISPDRLDRIRSEVVLQRIPPGVFTDGRDPGWYVAEVIQPGEPC